VVAEFQTGCRGGSHDERSDPKRKNHSADIKGKVELEAIGEEMTLAELFETYGVHPTQIGTWKRAAIEGRATAFTRRGGGGTCERG